MPTPPLPDVLRWLLARRVLFVGGKGGVGKTTIAAALGTAAAERGRRCVVVSTDPAHSLGDVFDVAIGAAERPLAEGLWGLEIDAQHEAERHIAAVKQQMKGLVHPRMYDEVDRQLDLARYAPGTEEAALLERMAVLMGEAGQRFDLVIFDTAPTGHTLRLLSLPEIMAVWTEGLLRSRDRSSRLGSMLQRLGGGPGRGDDQSLVGTPSDPTDARTARLREVLVTRQRTMRRARDILLDADLSGFVLVLNPDKLSILESKRALQWLERSHLQVSAVIVNRVLPEGEVGAFLDARRRQEAVYLVEIGREFAHLPTGFLPLLPGDVRGLDALRQVGRLLTGV